MFKSRLQYYIIYYKSKLINYKILIKIKINN